MVDLPDQGTQEVEGTAWFRRDPQNRQLAWGSEGANNYHGRLTVSESGETGSRVVLDMHTESGHEGIEQALDESLAALDRAVHADA